MRCRLTRHAVTLLEMLAIVALLSLISCTAMVRLGPSLIADFGSEADARRLALDLLQAQRRAITTGDNHFVEFAMSGGSATGYTLMRRSGATTTAVDASRTFPTQVTVTPSASTAEYQFDGSALGSYQITLVGPHQSWRVTVVPLTGAVKVVKL